MKQKIAINTQKSTNTAPMSYIPPYTLSNYYYYQYLIHSEKRRPLMGTAFLI